MGPYDAWKLMDPWEAGFYRENDDSPNSQRHVVMTASTESEAHYQLGEQAAEEAPPLTLVAPIVSAPEVDFEERGSEQQIVALYAAFAEARGDFGAIVKNRKVTITPKVGKPYTFEYADMDASLSAVVVPLSKRGLAVLQPLTRLNADIAAIRTMLVHKDGGRVIARFPLEMANDMKTFAGDVTYARRY